MTHNTTHILIVEDEQILAWDLRMTLQNLGYTVVGVAASGEEAIQQALATTPDLVLMDIRLHGGLDGVDAATYLRANTDIPVLYLTAYADEPTLLRAKQTEPYGYLLKPFKEAELYTSIETALYKHRMDAKLKQVERWLTTTLNSIGAAIITTDSDGLVSFLNPAAETLLGVVQAQVLKTPIRTICVFGTTVNTEAIHPIEQVIQTGETMLLREETLVRVHDGLTRVIDGSIAPIRQGQRAPQGAVFTFQDVGERQSAVATMRDREELYRLITENTRDLVMVLDQNGSMVYASPSFQVVLGYQPEKLQGILFFSLLHPDDLSFTQEQWQQVQQSGWGSTSNRIRHADGTWRWFETSGIVSSYHGQPHVIGVGRDITARKQLEAQLLQTQKMESLGRLAGGVAHDFNNLLMAMLGYINLVHEALPPNSVIQADVVQVQQAAERGLDLTKRLLAFARQQPLSMRPLNINTVIQQIEPLLARLLGDKNQIVARFDPTISSIIGNRSQLEQVLMNLAANARDAMPEGGTFTITTQCIETVLSSTPEQVAVRMVISDTGTGMPADVLQHIFEPFFTTKEPEQGTGLGLSTCYGVVTQLGGSISCQSTVGKGTTFIITLPVSSATGANK